LTTDGSIVKFDRVKPTLNPVTIFSNNIDTLRAIVGNVITLKFTSLEGLTNVTAEIGGHASTAPVSITNGTVWTTTYTMLVTDNEGVQGFSISFQDSTGNIGSIVTNTSDGSSVIFDRTLPSLSNVAIVSNNPNTSKAKTSWTFSKFMNYLWTLDELFMIFTPFFMIVV
jgi:hypothetical protein